MSLSVAKYVLKFRKGSLVFSCGTTAKNACDRALRARSHDAVARVRTSGSRHSELVTDESGRGLHPGTVRVNRSGLVVRDHTLHPPGVGRLTSIVPTFEDVHERGALCRRLLAEHLVQRDLRLVQERHVTSGNGNPGPAPTTFRKNLEVTHAQDRGVRAAICDVGVDRRHLVPQSLDTLVELVTVVIGLIFIVCVCSFA